MQEQPLNQLSQIHQGPSCYLYLDAVRKQLVSILLSWHLNLLRVNDLGEVKFTYDPLYHSEHKSYRIRN